ncbi:MAG: HAD-IB family hydrolase [Actinomycetota bacterium]
MDKPVIAFFDLDHTLLDGSNGNIYATQMVREGYISGGVFFWMLWYSILYKANRLPREDVYRKVLDIMGRYTVPEMIEMMDRGFERLIVPRLYAGGVEKVREHRDSGHVTVIATAAGEYIAERARAQLGADAIVATSTPIKGEHMTSEIRVATSFMEGKLEMARECCSTYGADLGDCWFYSDSASDLPLLEAVGYPVMVNPQLKLRMVARGRGWPVVRFKGHARFDEVARPEQPLSEPMQTFVIEYEAKFAAG